MKNSIFSLCICLAWMATLAGCGSGGPAIVAVEGVITLDGKPIPDIRVTFQPENKSEEMRGMGSFGLTDADGKFVLKLSDNERSGAVVGPHTVILADKRTEDVEDSDAGPGSKVKSRLPVKVLNEPMRIEVVSGGKNEPHIDLKSK